MQLYLKMGFDSWSTPWFKKPQRPQKKSHMDLNHGGIKVDEKNSSESCVTM